MMSSNNNGRSYSCESASQTLEWMNAIADFLTPFKPLLNAHVVNFFKDRLWESVDEQWMDCLRHEPVEILLHIPSGIVQDIEAEAKLRAQYAIFHSNWASCSKGGRSHYVTNKMVVNIWI